MPALATQLEVTPTQLQTGLQSNFPAFACGVSDLPAILPQFQGLVQSLKVITGADFQDASSIPWASTSTTTLTLLFVIPGALLVLAGGLPLVGARQRAAVRPSRQRSPGTSGTSDTSATSETSSRASGDGADTHPSCVL